MFKIKVEEVNENKIGMNGALDIPVAYYDGSSELVKAIVELIKRKYSGIFHSVYVHGSISTNEIINYSDFDGLVIVKRKYFESKKFQKFKKESLKLIYNFDLLQHHGWFEIKEEDLFVFPDDVVPVELIRSSKLIFPIDYNYKLSLNVHSSMGHRKNLYRVLDSLERKLDLNWRPKNAYQLKSFLSQIMLIPCLYCAARQGEGVNKRDSFNIAKSDFSVKEWEVIKVASSIRSEWHIDFNLVQKILLRQTNRYFRKIVTSFIAPKISPEINSILNKKFFNDLRIFIEGNRRNISQTLT